MPLRTYGFATVALASAVALSFAAIGGCNSMASRSVVARPAGEPGAGQQLFDSDAVAAKTLVDAAKARDALIAADRTAREKMQSRQEQLSDMQTRMLKKTFNEIREVIRKYAEEKKLQVVLSANQVVYGDKTLDITDAILKQMNIPLPAHDAEAVPLTHEKPASMSVMAHPAASTNAPRQ